jgi:co-chaperonin GroES (HSP10)
MTKLQSLSGEPLEVVSRVPDIKSVRPVGSQVLVERLTAQEQMGTTLQIMSGTNPEGAPQGYVLAWGLKVEDDWGFEVGDRVVLTGKYTPLPEVPGTNGRELILVEPHQVKAVLLEK